MITTKKQCKGEYKVYKNGGICRKRFSLGSRSLRERVDCLWWK